MASPEFSVSPWPIMPDSPHPEAYDTHIDLSRQIEPEHLRTSSNLAGELLDTYNPPWKPIKNQYRRELRRVRLPLRLEGQATVTEEFRDGYIVYKVQKDQMDERTIWEWDKATGKFQSWRRSYLEPSGDDELMNSYVSDTGYTELILHRLEDTLEEISRADEYTSGEQPISHTYGIEKNDKAPPLGREELIQRAAEDPRVINLFKRLKEIDSEKNPYALQSFLHEIHDIFDEVARDWKLSEGEMARASEIAREIVGSQDNDDQA